MTIYITPDGKLIPLTTAEQAAFDFAATRARCINPVLSLDMLPLRPSDYTPETGGASGVAV